MSLFNPEQYPPEYNEGFSLSDQEAVEKVLQYIESLGLKVDAIVIEETDRGTVVHTQVGDTLDQINWTKPGQIPGELEGYASTVYMLAGPHEQQFKRAKMLAEAVEAPKGVVRYEDVAADHFVVQVMCFGLKVLKPKDFIIWG